MLSTIKARILVGSFVVALLLGFLGYLVSFTSNGVDTIETLSEERELDHAAINTLSLEAENALALNNVIQAELDEVVHEAGQDVEAAEDADHGAEEAVEDADHGAEEAEVTHEEVDWLGQLTAGRTELDHEFAELTELLATGGHAAVAVSLESPAAALAHAEAEVLEAVADGRLQDTQDHMAGEYVEAREGFVGQLSEFAEEREVEIEELYASNVSSAKSTRTASVAVLGAIVLLIGLLSWLLIRTIVVRVRSLTAVTDKIAQGDIEGLSIDVSGSDEIGRLGDSMAGVVAAFEMLYSAIDQSQQDAAGSADGRTPESVGTV